MCWCYLDNGGFPGALGRVEVEVDINNRGEENFGLNRVSFGVCTPLLSSCNSGDYSCGGFSCQSH